MVIVIAQTSKKKYRRSRATLDALITTRLRSFA